MMTHSKHKASSSASASTGRFKPLLTWLNGSRLVVGITRLTPDSGRDEFMTLVRRSGVQVEVGTTQAKNQAIEVYGMLTSHGIPQIDLLEAADEANC
ncbi:hypothetical protein ON010_g4225 [Phytophthora cinnamomi]|nr:hypothetical protein ON010_g4225 [Phytophthora cinnamomi]